MVQCSRRGEVTGGECPAVNLVLAEMVLKSRELGRWEVCRLEDEGGSDDGGGHDEKKPGVTSWNRSFLERKFGTWLVCRWKGSEMVRRWES